MGKFCVGIDISKLNFVAGIKINDEYITKSFSNKQSGFDNFLKWITKHSTENYHFCMESTGKYGDALMLFLYNKQHDVSIVNPARIKYFMQSQMSRNKNDPADAKYICQYCALFTPSLWQPLSEEVQVLQALVKRLDSLQTMLLQEKNRLENVAPTVKESIENSILFFEDEMKNITKTVKSHIGKHSNLEKNYNLLKSIPGIGDKTVYKVLAFFSHVKSFENAKKMAAFVGINPRQYQSGTSLNHSHISRTGSAYLRKIFYMPALVALRHEPSIKLFYEKLLSKGKAKKVAICAVMRKLIHIIYGVLTSQKIFDATLLVS